MGRREDSAKELRWARGWALRSALRSAKAGGGDAFQERGDERKGREVLRRGFKYEEEEETESEQEEDAVVRCDSASGRLASTSFSRR